MFELLKELWPYLAVLLVGAAPSLWQLLARYWDPKRQDHLSTRGWDRAGSLEQEIKSLRVLLDRCRRRESAKDAVIEILLLALELGDELNEEMAAAFITRAKETLKRSVAGGR